MLNIFLHTVELWILVMKNGKLIPYVFISHPVSCVYDKDVSLKPQWTNINFSPKPQRTTF